MAQRRSGRSGTAGGVSSRVSRRDLLRGLSAASLLATAAPGRAFARALSPSRSGPRVVVVGAGAFGAFSALSLLRRGAREFLGRRFPALKGAPLTESRVCQYENTADSRFILDRHPDAGNVWIAGGGSGHGFKMGPAVGERVADLVLGRAPVDPFFALARLSKAPAGAGRPSATEAFS